MVELVLSKAERIRHLLEQIPDPDIPVINIVELGLVRRIQVTEADKVIITLTPSYFGCPALPLFTEQIRSTLAGHGMMDVVIKTVLTPAWTTAWLSDETKEKMRQHGIAPPETEEDSAVLFSRQKQVTCPRCGKAETHLVSRYGSTPCKAMWYCQSCDQPFEYFKCH